MSVHCAPIFMNMYSSVSRFSYHKLKRTCEQLDQNVIEYSYNLMHHINFYIFGQDLSYTDILIVIIMYFRFHKLQSQCSMEF